MASNAISKFQQFRGGTSIASGAVTGPIFPRFTAVFQGPKLLIDSARMRATHNKAARAAGEATMLLHWKNRIPNHFKQTNRNKYDHAERTEYTKALKRQRHGSITDLVKTGATRDHMTSFRPKIRIGGAAVNKEGTGLLSLTMELRFPFPVRFDTSERGVNMIQMASEIARWTDDEIKDAANDFAKVFAVEFGLLIARAPKIKKKLEGLI